MILLFHFLERKDLKFTAAVALSVIIGISTNLIAGWSGWKQALVVLILSLTILFIHLRRFIQCFHYTIFQLQHGRMARSRSGQSTTPVVLGTTHVKPYGT